MSWSLSLELDRPDARFPAGEPVTGKLHVVVGEKAEHNGIWLRWMCTIRASAGTLDFAPETSVLHEELLTRDTTQPGGFLELPFSFDAPTEPLSYEGMEIRVEHRLEASVDLALARDPSKVVEVMLVPAEEPADRLEWAAQPVRLVDRAKENLWLRLAGGVLLILLSATVPLGWNLLNALLFFVGLWFAAEGFDVLKGRTKLGTVKLLMDSDVVSPGELAPVKVVCTPNRGLKDVEMTVTIQGVERRRVTMSGGKRESVVESMVHEVGFSLQGPDSAPASSPSEWTGAIQLPRIVAWTFRHGPMSRFNLEWRMHVSIHASGVRHSMTQMLRLVPLTHREPGNGGVLGSEGTPSMAAFPVSPDQWARLKPRPKRRRSRVPQVLLTVFGGMIVLGLWAEWANWESGSGEAGGVSLAEATYSGARAPVVVGGLEQEIAVAEVEPAFFDQQGVHILVGRPFMADDHEPTGADAVPPTVILTHGFWQTHLDGDPSVVGRSLIVGGVDRVIVGVLAETTREGLGGEILLPRGGPYTGAALLAALDTEPAAADVCSILREGRFLPPDPSLGVGESEVHSRYYWNPHDPENYSLWVVTYPGDAPDNHTVWRVVVDDHQGGCRDQWIREGLRSTLPSPHNQNGWGTLYPWAVIADGSALLRYQEISFTDRDRFRAYAFRLHPDGSLERVDGPEWTDFWLMPGDSLIHSDFGIWNLEGAVQTFDTLSSMRIVRSYLLDATTVLIVRCSSAMEGSSYCFNGWDGPPPNGVAQVVRWGEGLLTEFEFRGMYEGEFLELANVHAEGDGRAVLFDHVEERLSVVDVTAPSLVTSYALADLEEIGGDVVADEATFERVGFSRGDAVELRWSIDLFLPFDGGPPSYRWTHPPDGR